MSDILSRLEGVTKVEMAGKKAKVTFDSQVTKVEKIIKDFNKAAGRYKASESK